MFDFESSGGITGIGENGYGPARAS